MRTVLRSIIVKNGTVCVAEPVAAGIKAPGSANRAVIMPSNGAETLVYSSMDLRLSRKCLDA